MNGLVLYNSQVFHLYLFQIPMYTSYHQQLATSITDQNPTSTSKKKSSPLHLET